MSKKAVVPDAWDDDWVIKADQPSATIEVPQEEVKISKAERRAKQAEFNRKLWEEAESPKDPYFVQSRNEVPLKSEFKPAVKVLSRKPTPSLVARKDSSGLEKITLDEEDEDDEDETIKKPMTMEERQLIAQKEREEKQRKYEEVRQRLFGASTTTVDSSSPNIPPALSSRPAGDARGKGKSRGGRDSRPNSSADDKTRQLYDPNYTVKPDSIYIQKKDNQPSEPGRSTPSEDQPIRAPRGPDGSGRGGFGFVSRGG